MNQILYHSPLGNYYLVSNGKSLVAVSLEKYKANLVCDKVLKRAKRELDEYFKGKRKKFTVPLDPKGTPFQKKVWRALLDIPYGKTITYKELALNVESPKGFRAVGGANGKNPIPIIIPCHRVVATGGALGGYSDGLERKVELLKLEGLTSY